MSHIAGKTHLFAIARAAGRDAGADGALLPVAGFVAKETTNFLQ